MNRVVVIIPIYKSILTENERTSLIRCFKVLGGYKIGFISPSFLELSEYTQLSRSYNVDFFVQIFDEKYFRSIDSYNKLMLSQQFYNRFTEFEYMLIYQLDAYVFKDDLKKWCNKGYDFIGAPLIGKFGNTQFSTEMRVGNGGFSLRKVETYIQFFVSKKNVFTPKQIARLIKIRDKPYTRIFVWLLMIMGWRNKPLSCSKYWRHNEDDFWSGFLDNSNYALRKPNPFEALRFAFERFPKECYKITNTLPFGCHAWEKYQYEDFWKKVIK